MLRIFQRILQLRSLETRVINTKTKMASNHAGHLVTEFENSFQACLSALTNEDHFNVQDSEEVKAGVEQTLARFLEMAKQMECFFLQKRLLLSAQKPEQIIKEDINELKSELQRKEALIQKHYDKIQYWQLELSDMPGPTPRTHSQNAMQGATIVPTQPQIPIPGGTSSSQTLSGMPPLPTGPSNQTPNLASLGLSMNAGQSSPMATSGHGPGIGAVAMHQVPPGVLGMPSAGPMQPPGPHGYGQSQIGPQMMPGGHVHQQHMAMHPTGLQGPLAYLEKTTSNIGMPDQRH